VKNDLARALQVLRTIAEKTMRYEIARKTRVSFTAVRIIGTVVYMGARPSIQRRVYGI
jgi:hypothetical protein